MSSIVGKKAPSFKAKAVINGGEIVNDFSLHQYCREEPCDLLLLPKGFYFCLSYRIACISGVLATFEVVA